MFKHAGMVRELQTLRISLCGKMPLRITKCRISNLLDDCLNPFLLPLTIKYKYEKEKAVTEIPFGRKTSCFQITTQYSH